MVILKDFIFQNYIILFYFPIFPKDSHDDHLRKNFQWYFSKVLIFPIIPKDSHDDHLIWLLSTTIQVHHHSLRGAGYISSERCTLVYEPRE
jgi:hypothetical protein